MEPEDVRDINITLRQLRYFLTLAKHLHFGRAATALNISQPPLSTSLKQLEDNLGFRLFDRTNKSVHLTPAGVVFADHAVRVLGQLQAAHDLAAQTASGMLGKLTVAFVPSMLYRRLPPLLKKFQEAYPGIELHLHEMNSAAQIAQLAAHTIDFGLVHATTSPDGIISTPLKTERLVCCVPKTHRLAERGQISLHELAGDVILVFARDFAPRYHDRIIGLLHAANLQPHVQFRLQNWFTILVLVNHGMGVSIVPRSLTESHFADVRYIDLLEPNAEHQVAMIRRDEPLSDAGRAFMSLMKTHYNMT